MSKMLDFTYAQTELSTIIDNVDCDLADLPEGNYDGCAEINNALQNDALSPYARRLVDALEKHAEWYAFSGHIDYPDFYSSDKALTYIWEIIAKDIAGLHKFEVSFYSIL